MALPGTGLKYKFKTEKFDLFLIIPKELLGVWLSHQPTALICQKSHKPTPKKQQGLTCGGQGEVEEEGSSLVEQEGHQVLQQNTNCLRLLKNKFVIIGFPC